MIVKIPQEQINKILELFHQGFKTGEIAQIIAIHPKDMWEIFQDLNLPYKKGSRAIPVTTEQIQQIKDLAAQEITMVKIAKTINLPVAVVKRIYLANNLIPRGKKLKPLTEEQDQQVIELFDKKYGVRGIAKIMKISNVAVKQAFDRLNLDNSDRKYPVQIDHDKIITEKTCNTCKITKNIDDFRKKKRKIKTWNRVVQTYEGCCKDCERNYNRNGKPVRPKQPWYGQQIKKDNLSDEEYIKLYRRKYTKNREMHDPAYVLRGMVSFTIGSALRRNSSSKKGDSILKFLPYTMKELKEHLESLFEPWMSWQNWGRYIVTEWDDNNSTTWKWSIDHITPQSDLPYTSMSDDNFKKCWALSNLRPLSAKQNNLEGVRRLRHKDNSEKS